MKTLTFKYTKEKDGSTSYRTLLAMGTPSNKYSGIDISSIDPVSAAGFVAEAEALHEKYLTDLKKLQANYDLTHNYRQFLEHNMSEVEEI